MSGNNTDFNCDEVLSVEYDAVLAGLCAVLCVFGLVYVFFGYRCFTAVMFLSGLIFGGTTVFLMCREERIFQQQFSVEIAAGIAAGIGVLCGFITMLVRYVGLFLQGFFLGLLFAVAGILVMQSFYNPSTAWIPAGILFGTGVLFALLTLKFQRTFIIISTAVLGAGLITVCIDYFLEDLSLLKNYIWESLMSSPEGNVCWYTWVILGVWPLLSVVGTVLQWKVTSKGFDHTDVIIARGRRKQVRTHLVRERHRQQQASRSDRRTNDRRTNDRRTNDRRTNDRRTNDRRQQPSRHRSAARRQAQEDRVVEETSREVAAQEEPARRNEDDLPTYFECVQLGVGEPVTEQHNVIRTESGSYVSERGRNAPRSVQGDLVQGMTSGAGYAIEQDSSAGPSGNQDQSASGYVENARLRESQRQQASRSSNAEPIHQDPEQMGFRRADGRHSNRGNGPGNRDSSRSGNSSQASAQSNRSSGPSDSNDNRGSNQASKRFRKQGSGRARRSGPESDTQLLLNDPSQAKVRSRGDAVAAHGRRIMASQNSRLNAATSSREATGDQSADQASTGAADIV